MKRPTMLIEAVLHQAALDLDLSVERDIAVMRSRCKHEGLSFLTITLPMLSDALEQGLELGFLSCPTCFSRHGSLPRFLGGFFRNVFDKDGRLLPSPCADSVFYIRQICRFMKKLKIGCTPEREAKAEAHFLEVEGELGCGYPLIEREDEVLDKVSGIIWSQVFPEIDPVSLVCRHGPGATAERRSANKRWSIIRWNTRSEFCFPSDLHCWPNYGLAAVAAGYGEESSIVVGPTFLSVRDELPVRVVFVPKTQTTPRVIAIEPSHMQYMQQGVKDHMYVILESHRLTRASIRFTRQSVNQKLAYRSSLDKRLATLDLKDASDRVHLGLVQRIFKASGLLQFLEDARSLHAVLPSGRNIVLHKYASQGSALCFPVEACVFYTLIQTAMHRLDGVRPSSRSIAAYSRKIDIYGDDIIVPVEYAETVVEYLESYLLKVNVSKSFRFGNFRESCGGDFYNGVAVNPVYARKVPHDDLRHWSAEDVMSWNATADLFYLRGMWLVAQVVRDLLAEVAGSSIARTRVLGSGVAHASLIYDTMLFWDAKYQGYRQRRLHFKPVKTKDEIDGNETACLLKWGVQRDSRPESIHGLDPSVLGDRERVVRTLRLLRQTNGVRTGRAVRPGSPGSGTALVAERVPDISGLHEGSEHESAHVIPKLEFGRKFSRDETEGLCPSLIPRVDSLGHESDDGPARHEIGLPERELCSSFRHPSVFDLLREESPALDFNSSVKRGGFKSYRRWVSVVS